jgi:hypothetical protein
VLAVGFTDWVDVALLSRVVSDEQVVLVPEYHL